MVQSKKEILAKQREWQKANPDKHKKYKKDEYTKNKEKYLARTREWYRKRYKDPAIRGQYRERRMIRKHGIDEAAYQYILMCQEYVCAICKGDNDGKRFYVDHCHTLDIVRGLLCHGCNTTIGHAKDSIAILKEAIKYLERNYHDAAKIVQDFSGRIPASPVERNERFRLATISQSSARFTRQSGGDCPRRPHDA